MNLREVVAVGLTGVGLAAVAVVPFRYEHGRLASPPGVRTIVLTGVATDGIWTEDAVTGANYWRGGFRPAHLKLRKGETIRLVLRSADVIHRFYMPSLGIGPVELLPGHTEEVTFRADREGTVPYYCTALCISGMCHFYMRGAVSVGDGPVNSSLLGVEGVCLKHQVSPPPASATFVEKGAYVFRTMGCVTCHGADGKGGVPNFNYAKRTIPRLDTLAERLFLQSREEVRAFTDVLETGQDPARAAAPRAIGNWPLVVAQYQAVVATIQQGSVPARARASLPAPPLFMPRWNETLDRRQIDSIIAFLVSEQTFEQRAGWGE